MNIKEYTTPDKLERYSFLWSEIRLIFAAGALFLGGYPLILKVLPFGFLYRPVGALLTLSWLISGIASVYLLYRWYKSGRKLFGTEDNIDLSAFLLMTVSGINLGLVVILSDNIGMAITQNMIIFVLVGILYLISAFYLHKRWKANGQRLF